jgi:hypothetical protein
MASPTKAYKVRKRLKQKKAGRARKNRTEREGSTPTPAAFFGDVAPPPQND